MFKKVIYAVFLACLTHSQSLYAQTDSTDLTDSTAIYCAKKIISMSDNDTGSKANCIAVKGSKITALGSQQSLINKIGTQPYVLDTRFVDKVIMPGFIDNHLHPILSAILLPMHFITPYEWAISNQVVKGVQGQQAYLDKLITLHNTLPDGEPLFTWGYHHLFHGKMNKSILDKISQTRPIIVWHRSFHEVYANSAALSYFKFDRQKMQQHPNADWQTGHVYEAALGTIAIPALSKFILSPQWINKGLAIMRETVHQGGITTIADMATGGFNLDLEWQAMHHALDTEDTPFRTLLVPLAATFSDGMDTTKAVEKFTKLFERNTEKLFFVKQVKLLADGAFYSQLMQMQKPGYLDGHHGEWITQPAALRRIAKNFWHAGYQIHVHTNGDLGGKVVLDILQELNNEFPRNDHRFTLHHLGYIQSQQAQRIASLGALVSANPYYYYTLADKYSEIGLGKERAQYIFRGRDLLDSGVKLSLHSDFTMAPAQPLKLAWVAVNRLTSKGNVLAPEQKLTVHESLRAITIDAAHAIRQEKTIGSIEVGKKADFTILEQDPYQINPEELKDIKIWGTVFEGQVFENKKFVIKDFETKHH